MLIFCTGYELTLREHTNTIFGNSIQNISKLNRNMKIKLILVLILDIFSGKKSWDTKLSDPTSVQKRGTRNTCSPYIAIKS